MWQDSYTLLGVFGYAESKSGGIRSIVIVFIADLDNILKACKPDISDYWYNTDVQDVCLCDDRGISNKVPDLRRVCGDNSAVLIQSILGSLYSIIVQFYTSSYYQQVILQLKSDIVLV